MYNKPRSALLFKYTYMYTYLWIVHMIVEMLQSGSHFELLLILLINRIKSSLNGKHILYLLRQQ